MFKNYIKIALRSFSNNKGFSVLSIFGIAIGMTVCILILKYVMNEFSYDQFNEKAERIYRVQLNNYQAGELEFQSAGNYPGVGPALKEDIPEVEDFVRLFPMQGVVRFDDKTFREEKVFRADPSVFKIFSIPLVIGESDHVLSQPYSVVVSETISNKLFGNDNPIGKRINYNGREDLTVTGVFKDLPGNSHIKIDYLFTFSWITDRVENLDVNWVWYDFNTYVLLKPGADAAIVQKKLPELVQRRNTQQQDEINGLTELILQPLTDIHLYSNLLQESEVNGSASAVYMLLIISFAILIIAWINYINLSTSRAIDRAKEVGMRKVLGAEKRNLFKQFITESLLLNLSSFIVSYILYEITKPFFNELTGITQYYSTLSALEFWGFIGLFFIVGSFLSALYPSIILASYNPSLVLRGSFKRSNKGIVLRRVLVIVQFAASIAMIVGTVVVYNQIKFMKEKNLGFNMEQVVAIRGPRVLPPDSLRASVYESFKSNIVNSRDVKNVSICTNIPGVEIYWTSGSNLVGKQSEGLKQIYLVGTDYNYLQLLDLGLVAGRYFDKSYSTDINAGILNEQAVSLYNFTSPEAAINQYIELGEDSIKVVGVIKNFHQQSLQYANNPILFTFVPNYAQFILVKVDTKSIERTIESIKNNFNSFFPGNPFDYFFLDEFYNKQYISETQFAEVFTVFALIAILVACIGLFGLASYSAFQRTKEIGIRKVLGASVASIIFDLTEDFLKWVLIANIIAWPIAYFVMNAWLEEFAYRIEIGISVFIFSGLFTLLVALLTVSYQSVKASLLNPVTSLRNE